MHQRIRGSTTGSPSAVMLSWQDSDISKMTYQASKADWASFWFVFICVCTITSLCSSRDVCYTHTHSAL